MSDPRLHKRLKRFARYLLLRATIGLLALLPLSVARRLGRALGGAGYRLAGGERRKALEGLGRAFPERTGVEREALALACFQHLGQMALELGCVRKVDARIEAEVDWPESDRAVLDAALARGKGVVFVSGHVGNWELLARRVAMAGYPSQSIARETSDPRTTRMVEQFRAAGGVRSIWRGQEGAARQMLRALKNNEILGLLIDQDTKVQNVFVPFFGRLAATPRAAADLALRTGAAVVCGFCQREPNGRYRIRMNEVPVPTTEAETVDARAVDARAVDARAVDARAIDARAIDAGPVDGASRTHARTSSLDRESAAIALTARLSAEIEKAIRRAPEQWVWMHRRWKTQAPAPVEPRQASYR